MIKLENEKINKDKYYSVGYSLELKKYILVDVVTWIAWYNRYFEITEDEYNSFGTVGFDNIANLLHREGNSSGRFLFSDKIQDSFPKFCQYCGAKAGSRFCPECGKKLV